MENDGPNPRRSTRLSLEIPITITSLDPAHTFREQCKTVVVNAHGCGVLMRHGLEIGTHVMIEVQPERRTNGRIVMSSSVGGGTGLWLLGLEFDKPKNFWRIKDPPHDWDEFQ